LLECGLGVCARTRARARVAGNDIHCGTEGGHLHRYESSKESADNEHAGNNADLPALHAGIRLRRWGDHTRLHRSLHYRRLPVCGEVAAPDADRNIVTVDRSAWARPSHLWRIISRP